MTLHEFIPPPAELYLEDVHRLLYPEEWMTDEEKAGAIASGYLNEEGIREWKIDDLEAIGGVVTAAVRTGALTIKKGQG